jgi:hypothetical protein
MLRKSRKQLTTRFLHRMVLFMTVLSAGMALFFYYGNAQEFLDSTQSMILWLMAKAALFTVLLSAILIVLELVFLFVERKKLYIALIAAGFLCLIVSFCVTLGSHVIILLAKGI